MLDFNSMLTLRGLIIFLYSKILFFYLQSFMMKNVHHFTGLSMFKFFLYYVYLLYGSLTDIYMYIYYFSWNLLFNFTLMVLALLLRTLVVRYGIGLITLACSESCFFLSLLRSIACLCACSYLHMAVEYQLPSFLQGLMRLMQALWSVLQTASYLIR